MGNELGRRQGDRNRYICLVRASNDADGTTSTEAQLQYLRNYCDRKGMVYVDEVVLNGVTGSMPGRRDDLQALLDRKVQKDDFDVIVIQRLDRLTRGGSDHGFWFEHECKRVGLKILFPGDEIPDGRYSTLIKVTKYEAAQEQAFSISQRSTQGYQYALETGRVTTSTHTPYACWRLYLTSEGKPMYIIRDLRDGRQEKLDAETHAVLDRYGSVGGGSKGHYRKQKHEKVLLVPGDPNEVAVVREIFEFHLRQGWGGKRIADVLNRRGIPSPQGKAWSQHQVEVIYDQEAYTGRSVANRTSSAIYHERQSAAPKLVEVDEQVKATARRMPVRRRPREDWFIQDQPLMKDFLDADLRALAIADHDRRWEHESDPDRPKHHKGRHVASEYLLTGLLVAKQDGETLSGILCGRQGHKVRYYRHRRGRRGYIKGSIFNRMIPAEPLEDAILKVLSDAILSIDDLRSVIIAKVEQESRASSATEDIAALQRKREDLRRRTQTLVATLDEETLADAQPVLDRLAAERRDLDQRIAAAESQNAVAAISPEKVADAVLTQLRSLSEGLRTDNLHALRQTLAALVDRIVVDMETKEVTVEMAIAVPLAGDAQVTGTMMRPVGTSRSSASYETQPVFRLKMGVLACVSTTKAARRCYECRRGAA